MQQIRSGIELENTMPTTSGRACVISFDIIGSSKIKHIRDKEFFRNVFTRCNAIMSEGYDGKNLKANAYRVKEMGDGFLCSVGYPFQSMTVNPTNEAIDLAKRFAQVLSEEAAILHSKTPIACGTTTGVGMGSSGSTGAAIGATGTTGAGLSESGGQVGGGLNGGSGGMGESCPPPYC